MMRLFIILVFQFFEPGFICHVMLICCEIKKIIKWLKSNNNIFKIFYPNNKIYNRAKNPENRS